MQKKENIQIGIIIVLVIVLVYGMADLIAKNKKKEISRRNFDATVAPVKSQVNFKTLKEEAEKIGLKRDPFSMAMIESDQGSHLQGVLWDPQNPKAIINGQMLGVGQSVVGGKIIEIKKDRVILSDGASNIELILGQ